VAIAASPQWPVRTWFPARFCAKKIYLIFFFTKRLACFVSVSQLIELFCLGMHFGQALLQNSLDQDSGQNATRNDACRLHVVRKELASCCEGRRCKI
jgi:hypothetical protein